MSNNEIESNTQQDNSQRKTKEPYKWITFGISIGCYMAGWWRGHTYLRYDVGNPALQTPTTSLLSDLSSLLLVFALLLTIILGMATLPKWQGFFALAVVVLTVLSLMGV